MSGIFLIIFLFAWGAASFGLGSLLSKLFKRFTTNAQTGEPNGWQTLVKFLSIALVFLSPVLDQLIAYPKWQQLCATTGDFEWGQGMDEKKAFGREIIAKPEQTKTSIFPNVKVEYSSMSIYDAKTKELIFKKPHYAYSARAFMYLPSGSGDKTAPFLPSCATYGLNGENWEKKLQLKEVENQGK
ncbi:MAG: hypothetical protein Q8R74_05235 [Methylophilus sp.]|nr:hypothetical protein [Methylophilus sp.]